MAEIEDGLWLLPPTTDMPPMVFDWRVGAKCGCAVFVGSRSDTAECAVLFDSCTPEHRGTMESARAIYAERLPTLDPDGMAVDSLADLIDEVEFP